MNHELRELLNACADERSSDSYSYITTYGPRANWSIKVGKHQTFWTEYCNIVYNNRKAENAPCLAEKASQYLPLTVNLSLKFDCSSANEDTWEPYRVNFIANIVYIYQKILIEYFRLTIPDPENKPEECLELTVLVAETPTYCDPDTKYRTNDDKNFSMCDLRIQFPYAKIDIDIQNRLIRDKAIKMMRDMNVLSFMDKQPVGDLNDIVQKLEKNGPYIMYGSTMYPNRPAPYIDIKNSWGYIWNTITEEMIENINNEDPPLEDLSYLFELKSHNHISMGLIDEDQWVIPDEIQEEDLYDFLLPFFLSVDYYNRCLMTLEPIAHYPTPGKNLAYGSSDLDDIYIAERLMPLLSDNRFLQKSTWLDIGKALYNSDFGGQDGIKLWISFTNNVINKKNFDISIPEFLTESGTVDNTCNNLYRTFGKDNNITVKTLGWYAKSDSPQAYKDWHQKWCITSVENALSGIHSHVAEAFYKYYWLDYIYFTEGRGTWYEYENHRWRQANQGIAIKKKFSREFMNVFDKYRLKLAKEIMDTTDNDARSKIETTMKKISSITGKLGTAAYKSSLLTETAEFFENAIFGNVLDTNPDITGLSNGVLEIVDGVVIYRAGKPEDYVSMSTNIPFNPNFTWDDDLVVRCFQWLQKVFTDKQLLNHFLKFGSSCLKGKNSDKIFPIFTGEGDNSKSMIVKLFEATFSTYCIKLDVSNVTTRSANASGPTPQLARAKGTRIAFMDEPEDDAPMNKGVIKRWVGGDSFFCRKLQENGYDVQVSFKLILTCNKVPIIANADKAIKNRTRLFPFLSTWVNDPPKGEEAQMRERKFLKDPFFEKQIPQMAPAFMWILAQYYPTYLREGLVDPPIVTETTTAYWRDNDIYAHFCADKIARVFINGDENKPDKSAKVTLNELYSSFKTWYKDSMSTSKVPDRQLFKSEIVIRWGKPSNNCWYGIRILDDDEEDVQSFNNDDELEKQKQKLKLLEQMNEPGTVLI